MARRSDEELYAELEATRVEMWRTLGRRLLEEEAQRASDRAADVVRRERVERRAARERAVGIALVVLVALFVLVGLASSAADDSPCTLTAAIGYPECVEDLGPGVRFEWPWSAH